MSKLTDVKGVIFDYGGTIDTNSRHWAALDCSINTHLKNLRVAKQESLATALLCLFS